MRNFYSKNRLLVILCCMIAAVLLIIFFIMKGAWDLAVQSGVNSPETLKAMSAENEGNASNGKLEQPDPKKDKDEVVEGFSKKTVHPKARALLTEDFFWSILDENSPFGNDTGWDTLSSFVKWRKLNPTADPIIFVIDLSERFDAPLMQWKVTPPAFAKSFFAFGKKYVMTTGDEILIATAFGQLGIDGKVSKDLNVLAKRAIENEFEMVDRWREPAERKKRLEMIGCLKQALKLQFCALADLMCCHNFDTVPEIRDLSARNHHL